MLELQVHENSDHLETLLPGLATANDGVSGIPSHSSADLVTDWSWRGAGGVSEVTQQECDSLTTTLCLTNGPICQSSAGIFRK